MYPRGGRVGSLALAPHHRTSGSARTAPRQRCFDLAGAPFAFERAWPSGCREAPNWFSSERRIDTRLGSSPCGDGPN
eukprot:scaffold26088_cov59-Phaeocystis_antarctica.AAC.1